MKKKIIAVLSLTLGGVLMLNVSLKYFVPVSEVLTYVGVIGSIILIVMGLQEAHNISETNR